MNEWRGKELHEHEEGTGEKPKCRKMQGQNAKGTGGWERKEIMGNEEKLKRNEEKWEARLKFLGTKKEVRK